MADNDSPCFPPNHSVIISLLRNPTTGKRNKFIFKTLNNIRRNAFLSIYNRCAFSSGRKSHFLFSAKSVCNSFFTGESYYFMQYLVSFLILQSLSISKEESARCFTFIVLWVSCDCECSVALPRGAMAWIAVCDRDFSW